MIISRMYSAAGEYMGMPMIQEVGFVDGTDASMNALRNNLEAVEISRVPRRSGLVAKRLDGRNTLTGITITSPEIGSYKDCIQIGTTAFSQYAPEQPFGKFQGKRIIQYRRVWVSLSGSGAVIS